VSTPTGSIPERRDVYFEGMVQGVGFRYTARRIAARFAVTGYVQNLSDGRVRLVAEGEPEELSKFLGTLRATMSTCIHRVEERVAPATGEFREFQIRF